MMRVSEIPGLVGSTAKSIVKMVLQSRRSPIKKADDTDRPLIILANGPSLRETLDTYAERLADFPTLAVNFAANTDDFRKIKPKYYVLADPHFFRAANDPNVARLLENLSRIDWPMRLFVVRRYLKQFRKAVTLPSCVSVEGYNAVGAEGFVSFERIAYRSGFAMPRPRNVLIPSIMIGIRLGYRSIYICGADHSWLGDLRVNDDNEVMMGMTHFYKESDKEIDRVRKEFSTVPLHEIIRSYAVAFESYHRLRHYADSAGVKIVNSTPGSYIDAFDRGSLTDSIFNI